MCMKCVSVSSEGGVYSHIDPTNYMTTPLPLNGTSHQHCCTFCGERQWSVKEEEVEREVFVDEMRDRCARQESEFSEVKRLWNKWEEEEEEDEEGSDEETQTVRVIVIAVAAYLPLSLSLRIQCLVTKQFLQPHQPQYKEVQVVLCYLNTLLVPGPRYEE